MGNSLSQNGVTDFDESCIDQMDVSKINIDIDASLYVDETYTANYISGIFSNMIIVFENCQRLIGYAKQYFEQAQAVGESVTQPEFIEFNFNISGQDALISKGVVVTNGGNLNVRSTPGGDIVSSAANGESLQIIGEDSSNPGWTKVRLDDGSEAFVSSKYIKTNNISTTPQTLGESASQIEFNQSHSSGAISDATREGSINITNGHLNVRSSPNGNIISQLEKDDIVTILGQSEINPNWTKIRLKNGQEAVVFSQYLMEKK